MPPPEPLEEQIEAAIAARLATIQAGATYWTTPKVTRSLLPIDQYQGAAEADLVRGVLGVMRSSMSTIAAKYDRDDATMLYHRVAIWGYVLGDPDPMPGAVVVVPGPVAAGTRLNRLRIDVRTCLLAPGAFVLPIHDIRPDPEGALDTDDGAREPRAFFREIWRVFATEETA